MADEDEALANLAVGLNEDTKAKRGRKAKEAPAADADLAGEGLTTLDDGGDGPQGFDAEGQHTTALDRMEAIADETEIDPGDIVNDLRDFLIETIKARPKPWSATSQAEQRDVAASCERAAEQVVQKIIEAIATSGRANPVRILLTKIAIGTDVVITGKVKTADQFEMHSAVATLHNSVNKHVILNPASVEDYSSGPREAGTDPDEPGFGFEGDED